MNNENRFKQAMAALAAVYQNTLQSEQMMMYWETLGGYNPNYLDRAVKLHIADTDQGKWFPKPAHLIGYIKPMIQHDNRQLEQSKQLANRIERKESTPADKKRINEMLKGLINEIHI
tara:strand:- start:7752 stop:8102 length:351 start_codon:yes stop_codon:yes gene_type:complete